MNSILHVILRVRTSLLFYQFSFPKSLTNSEKISVLLILAFQIKFCFPPTLPTNETLLFFNPTHIAFLSFSLLRHTFEGKVTSRGGTTYKRTNMYRQKHMAMFKHMFLVQVGHRKVSGVICDNVNNKMQYSCLQAVERKACNALYAFRTRTVVKDFSFFLARTL